MFLVLAGARIARFASAPIWLSPNRSNKGSFTDPCPPPLLRRHDGATLALTFDAKQGWRTGRDSNPRTAINRYTLSRRAPSTTRPPVHLGRGEIHGVGGSRKGPASRSNGTRKWRLR